MRELLVSFELKLLVYVLFWLKFRFFLSKNLFKNPLLSFFISFQTRTLHYCSKVQKAKKHKRDEFLKRYTETASHLTKFCRCVFLFSFIVDCLRVAFCYFLFSLFGWLYNFFFFFFLLFWNGIFGIPVYSYNLVCGATPKSTPY